MTQGKRKPTEPEITVIVIRPQNPNFEALETVYKILATVNTT
jgi:hypothetical protein